MVPVECVWSVCVMTGYVARAIAAERCSLGILADRYEALLNVLHAALSCERRDRRVIEGLLYDAMEAENRLSIAEMDLEEMEAV